MTKTTPNAQLVALVYVNGNQKIITSHDTLLIRIVIIGAFIYSQ